MNFDDYQQLSERTSGSHGWTFQRDRADYKQADANLCDRGLTDEEMSTILSKAIGERRLATAAMGLSGEAGEVTDFLKKIIGHGHPMDDDKLLNEVGDVLWYCAEILSCRRLSLQTCAERNVEKLKRRYLDKGGFSSHASINREEEGV